MNKINFILSNKRNIMQTSLGFFLESQPLFLVSNTILKQKIRFSVPLSSYIPNNIINNFAITFLNFFFRNFFDSK